MTMRLAMWSGPRNISTALMRSFGARPDCFVSDEPLYAHYLRETGLAHPHAEEVIQQHQADWREVVAQLTGPLPAGKTLWYQKHMSHHLLPGIERDWLTQLTNAFLIREPRAMLSSLLKVLGEVTLEDTGLPQQVELFRWERARTGQVPAVVDARELLLNPSVVLDQLCQRIGIAYDSAMLSWQPGPRATDGCWGPHWYGNTYNSSGFAPYKPKDVEVPARFEELAQECEALYQELAEHRFRAKA